MTPYDHFLESYRGYATTHALDALRASDYGRLDAQDQVLSLIHISEPTRPY